MTTGVQKRHYIHLLDDLLWLLAAAGHVRPEAAREIAAGYVDDPDQYSDGSPVWDYDDTDYLSMGGSTVSERSRFELFDPPHRRNTQTTPATGREYRKEIATSSEQVVAHPEDESRARLVAAAAELIRSDECGGCVVSLSHLLDELQGRGVLTITEDMSRLLDLIYYLANEVEGVAMIPSDEWIEFVAAGGPLRQPDTSAQPESRPSPFRIRNRK